MIKRFYVNNFRCLENFELPIAERPSTLLFGRNGSGKSTIRAVLEIFQRIAHGTNRVSELVQQSDFAHDRTNLPIRFELEVILDRSVYGYVLALELPVASKELQIFEESFAVNGRFVYSRTREHVELSNLSDLRDTNSREPVSFPMDLHLVALPVLQGSPKTDPLFPFISWLERMLILSPIPSLITGDSHSEALAPRSDVKNFGEWFAGLIAYFPAAYSTIDKYLREVMPDFKDIKNPVRGSESRTLLVQFQQDKASITIPFRNLSDGEKCFLICAVTLAANDAYGPLLCFWDEPDNYLALSEVGHFVMALRRSFQNNGQLLVTSHNPEAIRTFSNENTLILGRRNHLEPTIVRLLSEIPVAGDVIEALIRDDVEPWG